MYNHCTIMYLLSGWNNFPIYIYIYIYTTKWLNLGLFSEQGGVYLVDGEKLILEGSLITRRPPRARRSHEGRRAQSIWRAFWGHKALVGNRVDWLTHQLTGWLVG